MRAGHVPRVSALLREPDPWLVRVRPSVVFTPSSIKSVCSSLSPIKVIVIETKTTYKWHQG